MILQQTENVGEFSHLGKTDTREAAARITSMRSQFVDVDVEKATELSDSITDSYGWELPAWDFGPYPDDPEVFDQLMVLGNAVNYQFRDFDTGEKYEHEYDGIPFSGAIGMFAALMDAYDNGVPIFDTSYLAGLEVDDVRSLFAPSGDVEMPMIEDRTRMLAELGGVSRIDMFHGADTIGELLDSMKEKSDGTFIGLRDEFRRLVTYLDKESHRKLVTINFDKRLQLAIGMMYGRGTLDLPDPENMTVYADYNLPNILREHGVIQYDPELQKQIDNHHEFTPGETKEVEIRAATIHACDYIMNHARSQRQASTATAPRMDYALFSRRDDVSTPVHRCRTTAY